MTPPVENSAGGERIAKLLARAGIASRREVERMIAEGRIARDGTVLDTAATVLASLRGVTVDGVPVAQPEPARLFLYHKPTGLLVTERDPRGRPTIYDRLPGDLPRVVPVGRLDIATEGLLLLTTDGGFKRELELPATGVERTYRARAYGPVTQAQLEALIEGVEIEGIRYGAIDANLERRTGANVWIELTLTEGKNREVRRVLEHLGLQVGRLIRTRYGPFVLGDLPPGELGEVRQADLLHFRQGLASKRKDDTRIAIPTRQPGTTARTTGGARPQPARPPRPGFNPTEARAADDRALPRPRSAPGRKTDAAPTGKPFKWRGAAPSQNVARPDTGRGGAAAKAGVPKPARTTSDPRRERPDETPRTDSDAATTARPAKPQRKAGWARPKPKSGPPRRPAKPRA